MAFRVPGETKKTEKNQQRKQKQKQNQKETRFFFTPKQMTEQKTGNVLQLEWKKREAIHAVDVLMNLMHIGSPQFLQTEERDSKEGLAIWLKPRFVLGSHTAHEGLWKRIEVRSNPSTACLYITLGVETWWDKENFTLCKKMLLEETESPFDNVIFNRMDREITLVGNSLTFLMGSAALLLDMAFYRTSGSEMGSLLDMMKPDLNVEDVNLGVLAKHAQKTIKEQRYFKYLPLTYSFFIRLCPKSANSTPVTNHNLKETTSSLKKDT